MSRRPYIKPSIFGALCVAIIFGIIIWYINQPTAVHEAAYEVHSRENPRETNQRSDSEERAKTNIKSNTIPSSSESTIGPIKLRSIARNTYLQLIDSESLAFNRAVIDLLDVNPSQVNELNVVLKDFISTLQSDELAHAYVAKTDDSGEVIVVSPFDRSKLIDNFRGRVAQILGNDAADFIAEQTAYDHSLAVGNSELRVSIEHGDDGLDRVSVEQYIRERFALDSETPVRIGQINFAPTSRTTTKTLLRKGVGQRFNKLFAAADTLQRRK